MLGSVAVGSGLPLDDGAEFSGFLCGSGEGWLWMGESVDRTRERGREGGRERERNGEGVRGSSRGNRREGVLGAKPLAKTGRKKCTDFIAPRHSRIRRGTCARSASNRGGPKTSHSLCMLSEEDVMRNDWRN